MNTTIAELLLHIVLFLPAALAGFIIARASNEHSRYYRAIRPQRKGWWWQ